MCGACVNTGTAIWRIWNYSTVWKIPHFFCTLMIELIRYTRPPTPSWLYGNAKPDIITSRLLLCNFLITDLLFPLECPLMSSSFDSGSHFYCYDYVFLLYVYVWLLWLRFFRAFSSVVRQMSGWNPQKWGMSRILPNFCVILCIFVLFYLLFVLCRSLYCLCVYVYCTTASGWLPNCS